MFDERRQIYNIDLTLHLVDRNHLDVDVANLIPLGGWVKSNQTVRPDLGWRITKTLAGCVFDDLNGNGRCDGGGPSVTMVLIQLLDADYYAYTDRDRYFHIRGVPQGFSTAPVVDSRQPYLTQPVQGRLVIKFPE